MKITPHRKLSMLCLVTLPLLAGTASAEKGKWYRIDLRGSSETCLIRDEEPKEDMRVEWDGECVDGKLHGKGHLYMTTPEVTMIAICTMSAGELEDLSDIEFREPEKFDFATALGRLARAAAEGMAKNAEREKTSSTDELRRFRANLSEGSCARTWQHILTAWASEEWYVTEMYSGGRVELRKQNGSSSRSASKSTLWPCHWDERQVKKAHRD